MTLKTLLPALFAALLISTALTLPGTPALAQGGACLSEPEIQNAIAAQQIRSLPEILSLAGLSREDVVGAVRVCDLGGQLFYQVSVLSGGEAQTISLNAVTGVP